MKKVLVGAMALLALAACSNEEVLDQNQVRNEIGFTAVTGKALSRANDGYCNNSKPASFDVWARVGTNNYFAKETYNKGTGDVYSGSIVRFWPDDAHTVQFYAAYNYGGASSVTPVWTATAADPTSPLVINGYKVETTPGAQKDFIYAMHSAKKSDATDGKIGLNFRHALSQIEFAAKNNNPNIYVEISGVKLMNVFNTGNFAFPTSSTSTNYKDHEEGKDDHTETYTPVTIANQGKWTVITTGTPLPTASYEIATRKTDDSDVETKAVKGNSTVVSLTVTDPDTKEYNSQTLYVMPYDYKNGVNPWNGTGKPGDATTAYLALKCNIWNVAAGDGSVDKTIPLWEGSDTKWIAVKLPENTIWEQGKRYVYTFTFTTAGTGGIDPDGKDVLTPIKLEMSVDDFVEGEHEPIGGITMTK